MIDKFEHINNTCFVCSENLYTYDNFHKCFQRYGIKYEDLLFLCKKCTDLIPLESFVKLNNFYYSEDSNEKKSDMYVYSAYNKSIKIFRNNKESLKKIKTSLKRKITCNINAWERRRKLLDHLKNNKLDYKKNGICDSYIHYGYPDLNNIIISLQKETDKKTKRYIRIKKELMKNDLEFDDRSPAISKYIDRGGNLKETVKIAEVELFLIENTTYLELLKTNDNDIAKELALQRYIKMGGNNDLANDIIKNEATITFD